MAKDEVSASFWRLILWSRAAAAVVIVLALFYLNSAPGPIPLAAIPTTVFDIGLTMMIAAPLAALMFRSSRSVAIARPVGAPESIFLQEESCIPTKIANISEPARLRSLPPQRNPAVW